MKTLTVVYKLLQRTYKTEIEIDLNNCISIYIAKDAIVKNILYKDCCMPEKEYNAVSANIVEKVLFDAIEIVGFENL